MITQRQEPTLTLVKPKIIGPRELLVEADGREPLKVALTKNVKSDDNVKDFKYVVFVDCTLSVLIFIVYRVWGSSTQGIDCGDEAARWFADYLGKTGVRLVQHVDELLMRPTIYEKGTKIITDNSTKVGIYQGYVHTVV